MPTLHGPALPGRLSIKSHTVTPHSLWVHRARTELEDRGYSYATLRIMAARDVGIQSTDWTYALRPDAEFSYERAVELFRCNESTSFLVYRPEFTEEHHAHIVEWLYRYLEELQGTEWRGWQASASLQGLVTYACEGRLADVRRLFDQMGRSLDRLDFSTQRVRESLVSRLASSPSTDPALLTLLVPRLDVKGIEFREILSHPGMSLELARALAGRVVAPVGGPESDARARYAVDLLQHHVLYESPDLLGALMAIPRLVRADVFQRWTHTGPAHHVGAALGAAMPHDEAGVLDLMRASAGLRERLISRETLPWIMALPDATLRMEALTRIGRMGDPVPVSPPPLPTRTHVARFR